MRMFIIAKAGKKNALPKYEPAVATDKKKSIEEKRMNARLPKGDPKDHPLVVDFTYNDAAEKIYGDRVWWTPAVKEGPAIFNIDIDGCGVSIVADEYLTALSVTPKEKMV